MVQFYMKKIVVLLIASLLPLLGKTTLISRLHSFRGECCDSYYRLLQHMDGYFGETSKYEYRKILENNEIKILFSNRYSTIEEYKPFIYFKSNITLPNLNRKLKMSINRQNRHSYQNRSFTTNENQNLRDRDLHFGLGYEFFKKRDISFKFKIATHITKPHHIYLRLGILRDIDYEDGDILFESSIYKYIFQKKLILSNSIDFTKKLSSIHTLYFDNSWEWKNEGIKWEYDHSLLLTQKVTKKDLIGYYLSYGADNSQQLYTKKYYSFKIGLKHFFRKWLYIEPSIQDLNSREHDFQDEIVYRFDIGFIVSRRGD